MQKKRILSMCLALLCLLPFAGATAAPSEGIRGTWVPTVYNLDYPSTQSLTESQLKSEADAILDNAKAMGLNAVFLQVRPSSDAFYKSDIFPWSRYLTGTQGTAPENGFDPLTYWISAAHARGLQLHAWINPYRITKNGDTEFEALADSNPAKQHPEWVVKYSDNYYFDPAIPEVQQLVVDGAVEILKNYDVDGVHLDDYFYPGTDFDDSASFTAYGSGFSNIGDFRRSNVNSLIEKLDSALHAVKSDTAFGVSPAGIWDNKSTNSRGSDTAGRSSYSEIYCDTLAWIEAGTVDYICPQIYWSIGYEIADFSTLVTWWQNAVSGSDVSLYIGIGAYRMEDAKQGDTFYGTDEILRQLALVDSQNGISGVIFYRYNSLAKVTGVADAIKAYYANPSEYQISAEDITNEMPVFFDVLTHFFFTLFH